MVHKIHAHYRDVQEISIHFSSTHPPFLYRWPLGQILPSRLFALLDFVIRHCLRPLSHPSAISVPRLAVEDRFCTLNIPSLLWRGVCAAGLAAAWQTSAWMTGAGRRLAVNGSSPDTRAVCRALITLMWGLGRVVLCSEEEWEAGAGSERHYRGNAGTAAPTRIHNL